MERGSEIDPSTVNYYIDDCITQFKMQFGDVGDAGKVVKYLNDAKAAAVKNQVKEVLRLVAEAKIMI